MNSSPIRTTTDDMIAFFWLSNATWYKCIALSLLAHPLEGIQVDCTSWLLGTVTLHPGIQVSLPQTDFISLRSVSREYWLALFSILDFNTRSTHASRGVPESVIL